jgi:N6-L-threonylcarbamoyladenine synthase
VIGLGIETSCDETSIAFVRNGREVLSLQTFSQIELHAKHDGIVPEVASRSHLEKINGLIESAEKESKINLSEIDYISVTNRPGLLGSLMIGVQTAKALSLALNKPIIPVDHLEAHLSILSLEDKLPPYPYLGLLLSGGNSAIFSVGEPEKMVTICDTLDDAIGEAFDKVAILLGLGYPGGAAIEKQALTYTHKKFDVPFFPKILKDSNERIEFSYSGIKTSVVHFIKKNPEYLQQLPKICYDFQNSVFELVERNLIKAIHKTNIKNVVAAGGVLANSSLRNRLDNLSKKESFHLVYPEKKIYCTDNAAMVACQGYILHEKNRQFSPDFKISPSREKYTHET